MPMALSGIVTGLFPLPYSGKVGQLFNFNYFDEYIIKSRLIMSVVWYKFYTLHDVCGVILLFVAYFMPVKLTRQIAGNGTWGVLIFKIFRGSIHADPPS